jgi:hypothetical protein
MVHQLDIEAYLVYSIRFCAAFPFIWKNMLTLIKDNNWDLTLSPIDFKAAIFLGFLGHFRILPG